MSDEPISSQAKEMMDAVSAHMAPLQAVLSDAVKVTAEFGQLALKTCLTINGGALLAYPTLLKIFAPTMSSVPKGLVAAEHLFAFGTGCAAVATILAWLSAAWATWVLGQVMVLPVLRTQKNLAPRSMDPVQERRLRGAEWAEKWGQRISWGAISTTALIVFLGYCCAIQGGLDGAHLIALLGKRH